MVRSKSRLGEIVDATGDRNACIVDKNVDRTKLAFHPRDQVGDLGGGRDVGGRGDRSSAATAQHFDQSIGLIFRLTIVDGHGGARAGKLARYSRSDSA